MNEFSSLKLHRLQLSFDGRNPWKRILWSVWMYIDWIIFSRMQNNSTMSDFKIKIQIKKKKRIWKWNAKHLALHTQCSIQIPEKKQMNSQYIISHFNIVNFPCSHLSTVHLINDILRAKNCLLSHLFATINLNGANFFFCFSTNE